MGGGADRAAMPQAPSRRCLQPGRWSAEEDGYVNYGLSRVQGCPRARCRRRANRVRVARRVINTRDARVPWDTGGWGLPSPAFVSLHHLGLRPCEGGAVFIPA
jgi:hypothetical protein